MPQMTCVPSFRKTFKIDRKADLIRLLSIVLLISTYSQATAAEIVARSRTWAGNVSLERDGNDWADSCSLNLVAQFQQITHQISLKRPTVNCSLFGPVQIVLSEAPDFREALVVVEAARGGDGDHSGPLLELFRVDKSAIHKLGEVELFSARYIRKAQEIQSIEGRVLFSFCTQCDGPEASDPIYNIFVPVRVIVGRNSLAIEPTVTSIERAAIWKRFRQRKVAARKEYGNDAEIALLQKRLSALLNVK